MEPLKIHLLPTCQSVCNSNFYFAERKEDAMMNEMDLCAVSRRLSFNGSVASSQKYT
jgi:hypothetical protein